MAQAGISVQLSVKEIYERCCKQCRIKIRELIKEKITEDMVSKVLGNEEK